MKQIIIETEVDLPKEKVWNLLTNLQNYPKYFKYIKRVFYVGELKKGSNWLDLATVVYFPALVLHRVTQFEKEKRLEFYVPLLIGKIVETIDLSERNNKTYVKAVVVYDYGPIFGPIFNKIFEKRFTEMINEGIESFKKGI